MHCSCIRVRLLLGKATIHWAHSSEPTTWCECLLEWFVPLFSFLTLVDKTIHLPVFLVANVIFGFYVISYAECQSCLLTPLQVLC